MVLPEICRLFLWRAFSFFLPERRYLYGARLFFFSVSRFRRGRARSGICMWACIVGLGRARKRKNCGRNLLSFFRWYNRYKTRQDKQHMAYMTPTRPDQTTVYERDARPTMSVSWPGTASSPSNPRSLALALAPSLSHIVVSSTIRAWRLRRF